MDTFDLHNRKVYIAGESYAGQYIPYIASDMLDRKDKKYFNVKGVQIIDPSVNEDDTIIEGLQKTLATSDILLLMPSSPICHGPQLLPEHLQPE